MIIAATTIIVLALVPQLVMQRQSSGLFSTGMRDLAALREGADLVLYVDGYSRSIAYAYPKPSEKTNRNTSTGGESASLFGLAPPVDLAAYQVSGRVIVYGGSAFNGELKNVVTQLQDRGCTRRRTLANHMHQGIELRCPTTTR